MANLQNQGVIVKKTDTRFFFHPIDGTGSLTISWSSKPKGDAIEAISGAGVGFFSENGILLSLIFDEVRADEDDQVLEFPHHRVEVTVKHGQVNHTVLCKKDTKCASFKKRKKSISRKKRKK